MNALIHSGIKEMAYIAATPRAYIGKSIGSGQCVAFTQKAANMPRTAAWRRGVLVKGNTSIAPGTVIATLMQMVDTGTIPMADLMRLFIWDRMLQVLKY
jgi:hypothetical protein